MPFTAISPVTHVGGYQFEGPSLNTTNRQHTKGVPHTTMFAYEFIPSTARQNNIAAAQTTSTAVPMTLGAGSNTILTTIGGTSVLATTDYDITNTLMIARTVQVSSAVDMRATTFSVSGLDCYFQPLTTATTGPSNGVVETLKSMVAVISITPNTSLSSPVSAGFADTFGFPYVCATRAYLAARWSAGASEDTGTYTGPDLTSPATSATGDVRGKYKPSSASDGTLRAVLTETFSYPNFLLPYGVAQV